MSFNYTIKNKFDSDLGINLLVELDFAGYKKRFGTKTVGAGGHMFDGEILRWPNVLHTFSFRSYRYSAPSIPITLGNKSRHQDLDMLSFTDSGTGKAFLWSPSQDYDEMYASPIFAGVFRRDTHTSRDYTFQLVDFSQSYDVDVASLATVTGTISDNLVYLFRDKLNMFDDIVDYGSIYDLNAIVSRINFSTFANTKVAVFSVIDRLLTQMVCARLQINGKISINPLDFYGEGQDVISDVDIIGRPVFAMTPYDSLCNSFTVNYGGGGGSWTGEFTENRFTNEKCKESYDFYTTNFTDTVNMADVTSEAAAKSLIHRHINMRCFRHYVVDINVPYNTGFAHREGQIGKLTLKDAPSARGSGWSAEPCLLVQKGYYKDYITEKWMKTKGE